MAEVREARYRALIRSVPETIAAVFDADLRLVFAEGAGIDEFAPGLLPGTPLSELVPPERWSEVQAGARDALAGATRTVEFRDTPSRRTWSVDMAPYLAEMASINLSPNQLADEDLVARTVAILEKTGVDPARLCLEVTENALFTEAERAARTLRELRELGFGLAIDDFGVGFSSLYHLRQLPEVDVLKLDRAFVSELGRNDRDAAIVASVILLTNSLGMEALGEGIETADQADHLRTMGCDYGQGFWFGEPRPVADFLSRVSGAT